MNNEFVNYITELMQSIGPVRSKRMFGGHGLFLDGLMFALISDNVLYFKTDGASVDQFKSKALPAFSYFKQGKEFKIAYYQAPEEAMENTDEMNYWANQAFSVALKAASRKTK